MLLRILAHNPKTCIVFQVNRIEMVETVAYNVPGGGTHAVWLESCKGTTPDWYVSPGLQTVVCPLASGVSPSLQTVVCPLASGVSPSFWCVCPLASGVSPIASSVSPSFWCVS